MTQFDTFRKDELLLVVLSAGTKAVRRAQSTILRIHKG